jgi:hypothetical protein
VSTTDHERYEQDAAAYLLGALPPLEAEVFERHLMRCEGCREEVERLRPAAAALPRSVEAFEPPPSLKRSLMEVVEREAAASGASTVEHPPGLARGWHARLGWFRRGMRPQLAAGIAGVALLVGIALGIGIAAGGDNARTVTATVDHSRLLSGSARVEIDGNTAILRVAGAPQLPSGELYEVWVERDGLVRPAGALFGVDRRGNGSAAIPGGVDGVSRIMVTREVESGVDVPTEEPVIATDV